MIIVRYRIFIGLFFISMFHNLNAQLNQSLTIIDSKSKESIIGAEIYSFLQGSCFSDSDINGKMKIHLINPIDTLFQIQAIGYKHKKINKFELENSNIIELRELIVSLALGDNNYSELEYENFYRKCNRINLRGYYNKHLNGRWHSNSNNVVNYQIIQGRVLNINSGILVEEIYHYNYYSTYNKYRYDVIHDTIKGELIESISISSKFGTVENCKMIYEEINIPICELREDCTMFFNQTHNNLGYKKRNGLIVTWDDVQKKINPTSERYIAKELGFKNSNETQKIEGCWKYTVSDYCQKIVASYCFKNDSLMVYKNEHCQGGTSSLYKYKIVNDTIVAQELETYRNLEGFISGHYVNRMIKLKIPLCWFIKRNSCFRAKNPTFYNKGKFEFSKIIDFKWQVAGKVLENGKWVNYTENKQNEINTDENKR